MDDKYEAKAEAHNNWLLHQHLEKTFGECDDPIPTAEQEAEAREDFAYKAVRGPDSGDWLARFLEWLAASHNPLLGPDADVAREAIGTYLTEGNAELAGYELLGQFEKYVAHNAPAKEVEQRAQRLANGETL